MPTPRHQFLRFLLVGILNTAFGYAIFAVLILIGVPPGWALLAATLAGIVFNFFTSDRLVFASRTRRRFPRFVAMYGIVYVLNLEGLYVLRNIGQGPLSAQAALLPFVAILGYILNRAFVFTTEAEKTS